MERNQPKDDPSVKAGFPETLAGVVGGLSGVVIAGVEEAKLFHVQDADNADARIADLHNQMDAYREASQELNRAPASVKIGAQHYLSQLVSEKQAQIHAITEQRPTSGSARFAETVFLGAGEFVALSLLCTIGVHRVRKVLARHRLNTQPTLTQGAET